MQSKTGACKMSDRKNNIIPCEIFSRIVGYFRPVQNWNEGKKQEFTERNTFDKKLKITRR